MPKPLIFDDGAVCACYPDHLAICVCGPAERVLRAYSAGQDLKPMTYEQRQWCLSEIDQIEGYNRSDYATADDADLARTVLSAWTDYCRDKGMI